MIFKKNKKGLVSDILFIMIVMFLFAFSTILAIQIWLQFDNTIQGVSNTAIDPWAKDKITGMTNKILFMDKAFIYLYIALWILLIISSLRLDVEHPVFFGIFLMFVFLLTGVSMIFVNVYDAMAQQTVLSAGVSQAPAINFFMSYYHVITFIISLLSGVIFYSRSSPILRTNAP